MIKSAAIFTAKVFGSLLVIGAISGAVSLVYGAVSDWRSVYGREPARPRTYDEHRKRWDQYFDEKEKAAAS